MNTKDYWNERYRQGGTSGAGSRGHLAQFKAEVVSRIVHEHNVKIIADYGCGDGVVASMFNLPSDCYYRGYDPSPIARALAHSRLEHLSRYCIAFQESWLPTADLALSLDVVLHLTNDKEYEEYMTHLFSPKNRLVLIYGPCTEEQPVPCSPHVRFRDFCTWVEINQPSRSLVETIPNEYPFHGDYENESFSDFYLFKNHITLPQ